MTLIRAQTPKPSGLLKEFTWRSIGPANMGGRVDIEAVDGNPAIVYVGAGTIGVCKTENDGTTWTPVFDAQPNLSIGDIAIAPSNPDVVWVGTDDGNLQLSRDAGETWTNVADNVAKFPANYYARAVEPSHFDLATAYAAFDGHHSGDYKPYMFRTTDYGKTWTSLSGNLPPRGHVNVVREDRFNRNLLFAGTEFGFFASLDGGRRWTPLMNGLPATRRTM